MMEMENQEFHFYYTLAPPAVFLFLAETRGQKYQDYGHGIQIRTWDTNPDMGYKSGHGTQIWTFTNEKIVFIKNHNERALQKGTYTHRQ